MAILPLNQGGTGSDLSATGGSHQVVKQNSAGAALSVGPIGTSDLPAIITPTVLSATIFADQMTGADNSAKIQAAINMLPTVGGTVDARALPNEPTVSGTGSTPINPGTKAVTILLGPVQYVIPQIILASNLRVYGAGMGAGNTAGNLTIIQTTSNSLDAIVLPAGAVVQGLVLDGLRIRAFSGNTTQKGLNITATVPAMGKNSGLWYSSFRNCTFGADGPGVDHFRGGNMYFSALATAAPAVNQFLDFTNVQSFRNSGTGHCLDMIGQNGQFLFDQCEFDGNAAGTGTNINLADDGVNFPYSNTWQLCTIQAASIGVQVRGSWSNTFNGCHFENMGSTGVGGAFNLAAGANNNLGFTISNCDFQTSGQVAGAAYYVQDTSLNGQGILFTGNFMTEPVINWPALMTGIGNVQDFIPYSPANRYTDTTQNGQVFSTAGTFTFNVPNGVSSVKVRVIGGGGGGAGSSATINAGGGAAGGYTEYWITGLAPVSSNTVVQGQTMTVVVGAAGAGGAASTVGGPGGASSVAAVSPLSFTTVTANGGAGGFSTGAASSGGVATGFSSTSPAGALREGGNCGGPGVGGLGGCGGGSVFGGGGPNSGVGGNPGNNGTSHGAGGGGASAGGTGHIGGAGVNGVVIFEWQT